MRRQANFSDKPLNERQSYLEAVKAFFKQADHFADVSKMVADKPALVTSNKRS